jgi:hypothetical protein
MPDSFPWKEPYLAALQESDKEKLVHLVHAAESAIFLRAQELSDNPRHCEERMELKACCKGLLSIQINKLGWPSSLPSSEEQ